MEDLGGKRHTLGSNVLGFGQLDGTFALGFLDLERAITVTKTTLEKT